MTRALDLIHHPKITQIKCPHVGGVLSSLIFVKQLVLTQDVPHLNTNSIVSISIRVKTKLKHLRQIRGVVDDVYETCAKSDSIQQQEETSVWEGDKKRAQLTGHWSSLCDLISLLLLRLEYHPLDPLTGISDSVDTVVRSAPQLESHQSTSQHTIKMTSAAPLGGVHVSAKSLRSSSKAATKHKGRSSLAEFNRIKASR